ncbi:hypothetical protein G6F24_016664 [Rhizopus arrhizus]|nr:hypothetical protein G6F24_016664 [Rhizopus arrhizus]
MPAAHDLAQEHAAAQLPHRLQFGDFLDRLAGQVLVGQHDFDDLGRQPARPARRAAPSRPTRRRLAGRWSSRCPGSDRRAGCVRRRRALRRIATPVHRPSCPRARCDPGDTPGP